MSNNLYMDIEEKLWKIIDGWRANGVTISDAVRSVLYLLTLKKIFKESMSNVAEKDSQIVINHLSPIFYEAKEKDYTDLVTKSGELIEKRYGLQPGFFGSFFANVSNFESWKTTLNASIQKIKEIPDDEDAILSAVLTLIMTRGLQPETYRTAPLISNTSLAEVLNVVLNVQNGDSFMDGTIGCGISALRCVKGTDASIDGMDINVSVLQIATLYMILSGRKKFELKVGDFTLAKSTKKYDKIAMDIPFAIKTGEYIGEQIAISNKWLDGAQGRDLDILLVGKALEVLNENGRAAIVVPNSFLSRSGKASRILREKILEKRMLKAVINLPALHFETGARSSVLLLEKNDDKILFIDIDSIQMPSFQRNRREVRVLTPEGRDMLINLLETKEEIKSISAFVDVQQVKEKQFDFSPVRYVAIKEGLSFRDMQTLNNELKLLYAELEEIEKENSKIKLFN